MAASKCPSGSPPICWAVCKSLCALINQVRLSSAADLAIELSTLFRNLMRKGGGQMPVAVKFRPGVDQHVFGETDSAQASLSALHAANGAFIAERHNDHQVHIAVLARRAPGVRAEKPDLLG